MNLLKYFCFILLSIITFSVFAQEEVSFDPITKQLFVNKKEIYFKFSISSKNEINQLTKIISIDNVKQNEVWAYANKKEFNQFLNLGYSYTVLPNPGYVEHPVIIDLNTMKSKTVWNFYPTYSQYVSIMTGFASAYPSICKLDTIGVLASGRMLLAVKISDNVNTRENEPQFLYSSTMHGDETTGAILMLHLIDYLLTNYGTINRITNIVNSIEIYICPFANPDGSYGGGDPNVIDAATRFNANGVDLNRNYPDPIAGQHPDGNPWQEETQFFMTYADNHDFVMAGNFHGGAEVANYPWDDRAALHADDSWWQRVSNFYADTAQTYGTPGYFTSVTTSGITNGYAWYLVEGGRQDYMNAFHYCREETFEVSNTKNPSSTALLGFWDANYRSLLNYVEESTKGIHGIVTDSCTGNGVKAKVLITTHDHDSSHVYTSLPIGNYYRPIIAGTYNLTFSASGYQSKTINNVVSINGGTTIQNVVLKPIVPTAAFTADVTTTCDGLVYFTNQSSLSADTYLWDFGDGTTSNLENPSHSYMTNGTFSVSLTITNCAGSDIAIQSNYIVVNAPNVPTTTSDASCTPAILTLTANGTGTIQWFDAPVNGNLVFTGSPFVTPLLNNTIVYYVQDSIAGATHNAGKTTNTGGGGYTSAGDHYEIFDCLTPVKLVSVGIYGTSPAPGNKTIELRNSSGTVLQSTIVNVLSGLHTYVLNFDIPAGTNLRLACTSGIGIYRNNGGVTYNYNTPGFISVTGSDAGSIYYYFFYDWVIQEPGCVSPRVPVTASILGIPIADFSTAANNLDVSFTDLSTDATNYFWDFGDGNTSNIQNPSHTYALGGTYTAQLIVTNICGADTTSYTFTIYPVGIMQTTNNDDNFVVFPNPSNGIVHLNITSERKQFCTIKLFNLIGKEVSNYSCQLEQRKNMYPLDLSSMAKGVYFVQVFLSTKTVTKKIVIR